MLSEKSLQIVKATAAAVAPHAETITRRFYQLMFAGNPEVQAYFNPAHQYTGGQQRALAAAICAYAANIDNLAALGSAVELIAQKHCSLGILPEHYPIVGTHLLVAIKDVLGDAATDEVIAAWAEAYGLLADIFIQREAEIYGSHESAAGGWRGYRQFFVQHKIMESEIVTSFVLQPVDGRPIRSFKPGQYITVKVANPKVPTTPRNYSLSDHPDAGHYRISVKREPSLAANAPVGLISNYLHDEICEGDVLEVGPPCGHFFLEPTVEQQRPIVLISGGIGVTPLLSMLKSLIHHRSQTPITFIHGARNSRQHAFAKEVQKIAAANSNVRVHYRYDAPEANDVSEERCHSTGIVDIALLKQFVPDLDAEFYFCGPKPFMIGVYQGLLQAGVDDSRLHFEFFGPNQELTAPPTVEQTKSTDLSIDAPYFKKHAGAVQR
ncbi:MAG: NO-inducible flavohemoprotein [Planctomycetota bacterium]|nr:NO-inducible flavohemoprotein [Planctomycetota bacterium]